jgi:hypothetical protein
MTSRQIFWWIVDHPAIIGAAGAILRGWKGIKKWRRNGDGKFLWGLETDFVNVCRTCRPHLALSPFSAQKDATMQQDLVLRRKIAPLEDATAITLLHP